MCRLGLALVICLFRIMVTVSLGLALVCDQCLLFVCLLWKGSVTLIDGLVFLMIKCCIFQQRLNGLSFSFKVS